MNYPKYEVQATAGNTGFAFMSIGPKGNIKLTVEFSPIPETGFYNLAFGRSEEDGSFNDLAVLNNDDRDRILATIVSIIYSFFTEHPAEIVFFSGSTPARTRLYRRVV